MTALEKISEAECLEQDLGGGHKNRPHRISENVRKMVEEQRFLVVPSHYIRKVSQKMYLKKDLNIFQIHRLYIDCVHQNGTIKIATKKQYANILNTDFNIGFFKCSICNMADEGLRLKCKRSMTTVAA